jgi:hypothetical protein
MEIGEIPVSAVKTEQKKSPYKVSLVLYHRGPFGIHTLKGFICIKIVSLAPDRQCIDSCLDFWIFH